MTETSSKHKRAAPRYAVRAVNQQTGESWGIHDSLEVCESELAAKLADWGDAKSVVDGPVAIDSATG